MPKIEALARDLPKDCIRILNTEKCFYSYMLKPTVAFGKNMMDKIVIENLFSSDLMRCEMVFCRLVCLMKLEAKRITFALFDSPGKL